MSYLSLSFIQYALVAAVLVGLAAPSVGIYLVQRRMALMGDGIGHVALTGVAAGFLLGTSPVLTAVVVSAVGATIIEVLRSRGRASGDVALAMLFYGGIAGGVLLISLQPGGNANLLTYLFGSILTVTPQDLVTIGVLAVVVLSVTVGLRRSLFSVCQDEEFAKVSGLPVRTLNVLLAVTAALTVTVAMRVVGLLLVSALLVVPVAAAQQLTRGFAATMAAAMAIGVAVSVGGVLASYPLDVGPGALIVVMAIGVFALASLVAGLRSRFVQAPT
ncbi:MAG: metal ABC transporter permease [Geodermatophilaceae bacterium]|nr:metal ABC transporter permease [Geodermatophilaceae bacterium]